MKIIWSQAADRDLAQIYGYLEARSYRAARGFLRRLFKAIDMLTEMPKMGVEAGFEMEREYRYLVVEHHKIYYYVEDEQLVIGRLWDTRQDPTKFFVPWR